MYQGKSLIELMSKLSNCFHTLQTLLFYYVTFHNKVNFDIALELYHSNNNGNNNKKYYLLGILYRTL